MASAMPELRKLIESLKAVNVEAAATKRIVNTTATALESLAQIGLKFDTSQLKEAQANLYLLQEYSKNAHATLNVLSQSAPFKVLSKDIKEYLNRLDLARQRIQNLADVGQTATFTIGEEGGVVASTEEAQQQLKALADTLKSAKTSEELFGQATRKATEETLKAAQAAEKLKTARRPTGAAPGQELDITDIAGMETIKVISGNAEQLNAVFKNSELMSKRLREAMDILDKEYKEAGISLTDYKLKLDAVNKSIQIQAALKKTIPGPEGLGGEARVTGATREVRLDIGTGEELNRLKEMQAVFKEFGAPVSSINRLNSSLKGMGLTLEDVTHKELQANDGLLRLSFSGKSAAGVVRRQTVLLNKQGEIVSSVKQKYEGLTGAISNNIVKVMNWGIAIGLVYGTFRKFQEAISEMIELESALADIQIITGRSSSEMGDALNQLANAAERTGLTLGQAAQGFESALRASSSAANETERMAMAQQLLADSLVYARLANLDTATAIDTLIGALKQSGIELDNAEGLLDKWVATSKSAKVSLQDLGESFAITAAQAKAVGVDIDELNGIIGAIAEVTTLSSTEIGNLARRMLSALESPTAVAALQEHGIAVKNLEGDYRDWMDVINDLYLAYEAGAISEKQLSAIGKVLGGGVRGGPQVVATVKAWGRQNEIAAASAEASGDAAEALGIKMDTLKGAASDLTVAFSMLAKTLGEDGGLLDFMTKSVDIFTWIIDALSTLTGALGSSTTKVIAFVAAWAAFKKLNLGSRFTQMTAGIGATATTKWGTPFERGGSMMQQQYNVMGGGFTGKSREVTLGTQMKDASGKFVGGVKGTLGPMMPALGSALGFAAIDYMSGGDATSIVGTGIGAAIGSSFGPIGALIGSQIGSTIGNFISAEIAQSQRESEIRRKVTRGDEFTGEESFQALLTMAKGTALRLPGVGAVEHGAGPIEEFGAATKEEVLAWAIEARTIGEQREARPDIDMPLGLKKFGEVSTVRGEEQKATLLALIEVLEADIAATKENTEAVEKDAEAAYRTERAGITEQYGPMMQEALKVGQREMISSWTKGESSRAEYTRFLANMQTLETMMPQIQQYAGEGLGITSQRDYAEKAVELAKLDPAALEFLQTFIADLNTIDSDMAQLTANTHQWTQLSVLKGEKEAELAEIVLGIINEAADAANKITFDVSYTRRSPDMTMDVQGMLMQKALAQQAEVASELETTPDVLAEQATEFMEIIDGEIVTFTGIQRSIWNDIVGQWKENLEEMKTAADEAFHVQRLKDVSPEKFGEMEAKNRYWLEYMARIKGMSTQEYVQEEGYTENLIMGPNNVWQKMLTTSEAMNFTLQDILETEKKQLEGMWNIPEGAQFWVPITSLFYQGGEGGGGVPELPPLEPIEERPDKVFDPKEAIDEIVVAAGDKKEPILTASDRARAFKEFYIEPEAVAEDDTVSRFSETLAAQFAAFFPGTFETAKETFAPMDKIIDALDEIGADPLEKEPGGLEGVFDSINSLSNSIIQQLQSQQDRPLQISLTEGETEINLTSTIMLEGNRLTQIVQRIIAAELGRSARSQGYTGTLRS